MYSEQIIAALLTKREFNIAVYMVYRLVKFFSFFALNKLAQYRIYYMANAELKRNPERAKFKCLINETNQVNLEFFHPS